MSTHQWNGCSERLTEKIYPNLTSKACWLSLWPQASKESERHPSQMPRLLLERGISLNLRVSGRRKKVKAKNGREMHLEFWEIINDILSQIRKDYLRPMVLSNLTVPASHIPVVLGELVHA